MRSAARVEGGTEAVSTVAEYMVLGGAAGTATQPCCSAIRRQPSSQPSVPTGFRRPQHRLQAVLRRRRAPGRRRGGGWVRLCHSRVDAWREMGVEGTTRVSGERLKGGTMVGLSNSGLRSQQSLITVHQVIR